MLLPPEWSHSVPQAIMVTVTAGTWQLSLGVTQVAAKMTSEMTCMRPE